ncbi:HNH endonuclease [Rhizobium sp. UPM1132]|uniref:HNH endonuclease n=1 Tax=Rhizobium ruizarguesonis TaxID=2081791 RepID=UPI0014482522|nr:HNH endonuclease [Rhizobium ruizarguesonis]NKQ75083.1 HNH endonuclease [Rhizobium ruizarguesonis]
MWSWDQGRLDYFQFDNLKKIAKFALNNDLRLTDRKTLHGVTRLPFLPDDDRYPPWRNYSRVFGLSLICARVGTGSRPTKIAQLLASDGGVTTDEYFHFLCEATTDPSPVLQDWNHATVRRYPLLFSLKFMLARAAVGVFTTSISEIVASYGASGFVGDEDQAAFVDLINEGHDADKVDRQAAESIQVIAQISYLSLDKRELTVSLTKEDATNLFDQLDPIGGDPLKDGAEEIFRITDLFESAVDNLELDYATTAVSDVEEAGFSANTTFAEGAKSRKTHLIIERNGKIRLEFFKTNPSPICDFCETDTSKTYPWTPRILDIHHLLPLCSGARTSKDGTMLDDLVAVCPTCHRGIHRFYDAWLKNSGQRDFLDAEQAKVVYGEAKGAYKAATT